MDRRHLFGRPLSAANKGDKEDVFMYNCWSSLVRDRYNVSTEYRKSRELDKALAVYESKAQRRESHDNFTQGQKGKEISQAQDS